MTYQQRNDAVQGFVYLLKAKGMHGIFPGCYLSRVKIGLSRNVERRLETLHSNQPPTDLEVIKIIAVENMVEVENYLHQVFKNQNVKLVRSREYFDLNPFQLRYCIYLMNRNRADIKRAHNPISMKALAGGLIALLGVGILIGQSFQPQSTPQVKVEKSVKHK